MQLILAEKKGAKQQRQSNTPRAIMAVFHDN